MIHRTVQRSALAFAFLLAACGAHESDALATTPVPDEQQADPAPAQVSAQAAAPARADDDVEAEPAPEPPPEPEPIEVEAGERLGPIRIGMSEDDVRALGLEETASDEPGSRRFGPYRVFFDARGVRRVESRMGELGRIRIAGEIVPSGTDIHRIRDIVGGCEWYEGGGERYRCAGGTFFVHTTHSMDPALYTVAVQRR